jgi:hypothetical protein
MPYTLISLHDLSQGKLYFFLNLHSVVFCLLDQTEGGGRHMANIGIFGSSLCKCAKKNKFYGACTFCFCACGFIYMQLKVGLEYMYFNYFQIHQIFIITSILKNNSVLVIMRLHILMWRNSFVIIKRTYLCNCA